MSVFRDKKESVSIMAKTVLVRSACPLCVSNGDLVSVLTTGDGDLVSVLATGNGDSKKDNLCFN